MILSLPRGLLVLSGCVFFCAGASACPGSALCAVPAVLFLPCGLWMPRGFFLRRPVFMLAREEAACLVASLFPRGRFCCACLFRRGLWTHGAGHGAVAGRAGGSGADDRGLLSRGTPYGVRLAVLWGGRDGGGKGFVCARNGIRTVVLPVAVCFDFVASVDDGLVLWLLRSRWAGFVAPAFSAGDCGRMALGHGAVAGRPGGSGADVRGLLSRGTPFGGAHGGSLGRTGWRGENSVRARNGMWMEVLLLRWA